MSPRKCGKPAYEKVYWPGSKPVPMCEEHWLQAQGVSSAMGFYVATEPAAEGEMCASAVDESTVDLAPARMPELVIPQLDRIEMKLDWLRWHEVMVALFYTKSDSVIGAWAAKEPEWPETTKSTESIAHKSADHRPGSTHVEQCEKRRN